MTEPIHIISLGAGVQSSTMALMAANGEITPMPKCAIFADTGDEPTEVISQVEYLNAVLPFPVFTVMRGRLSDNLIIYGHSQIPAFMRNSDGAISMGKRQCTTKFKIEPIHKKIREIAGRARDRSVVLWIGISTDEVSRAKDSREPWMKHRFPLLDARMSRRDCISWLERNGYKIPPKSACVYCPYKDKRRWAESKRIGGRDWTLIRRVSDVLETRGEFLTKECLPIEQVDFSTEEDRGQLNMFNNECEGMCGV